MHYTSYVCIYIQLLLCQVTYILYRHRNSFDNIVPHLLYETVHLKTKKANHIYIDDYECFLP